MKLSIGATNLGFQAVFNITPAIARGLMRIEAAKHATEALPIAPRVLANLREIAWLYSTGYSKMIEGNLLTPEQVAQVIAEDQHFPGRERDQQEVRGYYAALDEVERLAGSKALLTEKSVQSLHAIVMGNGTTRTKPTPYRCPAASWTTFKPTLFAPTEDITYAAGRAI